MIENENPAGDKEDKGDVGVNERIARRVRELRARRGYTLDTLAARCGVSRSMISLLERGATSPTAIMLEKLAAGLGVSMANLFAGEREGEPAQPLARRGRQAQWRDPESNYLRRALSPPGWPSPLQLVEVEFPPGARVAYETGAREQSVQQQIWVIRGRIDVTLGDQSYELHKGDCLAMRLDQPLLFSNPDSVPAHYLVAICDRPSMDGMGHT